MTKVAMHRKGDTPVENSKIEMVSEDHQATRQESDPWAPVGESYVLHDVPLAEVWDGSLRFALADGTIAFKVLQQGSVGRMRTGDPKFQVTIGNELGEVVAVVRREAKNAKDGFTIYGTTPSWAGQSATAIDTVGESRGMYAVARLVQSPLGKTYKLRSPKNKVLLKAVNWDIPCTLVWCTCAVLCGCCKWKLDFFKPGERATVISRDQDRMTLTVAAGESLLMAICIAYAVDRLTIMSC